MSKSQAISAHTINRRALSVLGVSWAPFMWPWLL